MTGAHAQAPPPPDRADEAHWRAFLENPDSMMGVGRRLFSRLPGRPTLPAVAPSPIRRGSGAPMMRALGKKAVGREPDHLHDVRDGSCSTAGAAPRSTTSTLLSRHAVARRRSASGCRHRTFRTTLNRYYSVASDVVYEHGGIVDKFVGDELVAAFPPFLRRRSRSARRRCGHGTAPPNRTRRAGWAVGSGRRRRPYRPPLVRYRRRGSHVEITVLGDVVNTTARLGVGRRGR